MAKLTYIRSQIDCVSGITYTRSENQCSKWSIRYKVVGTTEEISVIQSAAYLGYVYSSDKSLGSYIQGHKCYKWDIKYVSVGSSSGLQTTPIYSYSGYCFSDSYGLNAYLNVGGYIVDIGASILGLSKSESSADIAASINCVFLSSDLHATISAAGTSSDDISASILAFNHAYLHLGGVITCIKGTDISSVISSIEHYNLRGITRAVRNTLLNIHGYVFGECPGSDGCSIMSALVRVTQPSNIKSIITANKGSVLFASIESIKYGSLYAGVYGVYSSTGSITARVNALSRGITNLSTTVGVVTHVNISSSVASVLGEDLPVYIRSTTFSASNITSYIRSTVSKLISLVASMYVIPYVDIQCSITSVPYVYLQSRVSSTLPINLNSVIYSIVAANVDITGYIIGLTSSKIGLRSTVDVVCPVNLVSYLCSVGGVDLSASSTTILPYDISGAVTASRSSFRNFMAVARATTFSYGDLEARTLCTLPTDLHTHIHPITHSNIKGVIGVKHKGNVGICSNIHSWGSGLCDLGTCISSVPSNNIIAYLYSNPSVCIKGSIYTVLPSNLYSYIYSVTYYNLLCSFKCGFEGSSGVAAYLLGFHHSIYNIQSTVNVVPYRVVAGDVNAVSGVNINAYIKQCYNALYSLNSIILPIHNVLFDLNSYLQPIPYTNLLSYAYSVVGVDLISHICGIEPVHLRAYIVTSLRHSEYLLGVIRNVTSSSSVLDSSLYVNRPLSLAALLESVPYGTLLGYITQIVSSTRDIKAAIRREYNEVTNIGSVVSITDAVNITALIGNIGSPTLVGVIKGSTSKYKGINSFIKSKIRQVSSLVGILNPFRERLLGAEITGSRPKDLNSYLKVYPSRGITANLHGFDVYDLSVICGGHYPKYLNANMRVVLVTSLVAYSRGWGKGKTNISARVKPEHVYYLNAFLTKYFYKDIHVLGGVLDCVPMYIINGNITGWAESNLTSSVLPYFSKDFLNAHLTPVGGYKTLPVIIKSISGKGCYTLRSNISGWGVNNIAATINSVAYSMLNSSLLVDGGSKSIGAYIRSSISYYDETYNLKVSNYTGLRATVGYTLCGLRTTKSTYTVLSSALLPLDVYNLVAVLTPVSKYNTDYTGLNAYINIHNKYTYNNKYYSKTQKYTVSDVTRCFPVFNRNSLRITFKVIKGYSSLISTLTCVDRHHDLGVKITPVLLPVDRNSSKVLYTENVSILHNMNIISKFAVDVYLRSVDNVYYAKGSLFSDDYTDIFSYDFFRKKGDSYVHRYKLDNRFFVDSDETIRYGISRVSGAAGFISMGSTITPVVKTLKLTASVMCKGINKVYTAPYFYIKEGVTTMLSCYSGSFIVNSSNSLYGGIHDMTASVIIT